MDRSERVSLICAQQALIAIGLRTHYTINLKLTQVASTTGLGQSQLWLHPLPLSNLDAIAL
jgi:hypothetical protein